jgi:hypothetical protein
MLRGGDEPPPKQAPRIPHARRADMIASTAPPARRPALKEPLMSFLTEFLARLIGIYCVIVAASMVIKRRETIATVNAMLDNPGAIMLSGVIALLIGLGVILSHNVWSGGALPVAVTLVGWSAAVKGAWLLATPSAMLRKMYAAMNYERFFLVFMGVTLTLGVYLTWASFEP